MTKVYYLDLDNGVAHAREDCPGYQEAEVTATGIPAPDGGGFAFCLECMTQPAQDTTAQSNPEADKG